jgi:hypothetical protein
VGILDALRQLREVRPHRVSEFGQVGFLKSPVEQFAAEFSFQSFDRVGQGWLRDSARLRGSREASLVAEGKKVSDLIRFHDWSLSGVLRLSSRGTSRPSSSRDKGVTRP